jgi:DNA repair protein RecO (recombination protein O)
VPVFLADALVLRTYPLGDADRIVVFLTRDRGKKRGVAKNARQSRRRFGGALEPLTEVRVEYDEREGRELVRLHFAEARRSPLAVAGLGGEGAGPLEYVGYFAELIDEWAQEADADERLYRLGVSMLEALGAGAPVDPLARYFEYWLLRLQGVYPEMEARVSPGVATFLEAARRAAPREVAALPATPAVLRELEGVHRRLIGQHLEKTLRSERVLRDLRR